MHRLFQFLQHIFRDNIQKGWGSNFDGKKGRKKPAWVDEDDDDVL